MQNTLDKHHFELEGAVLNEAGKLKVKAILDISPPQHRAIFVLRGATLDETAIKELVRAQLARHKVPRDVIFLSEIPRNATGKVLKRELRDWNSVTHTWRERK